MAERADTRIDGRAIAKRIAFFALVLVAVVVGVTTLPGVADVRDRFSDADPWWLVVAAALRIGSMLGFVRTLWAVFDRVVPWRRALVLGLAEQGANVLLPAGGLPATTQARTRGCIVRRGCGRDDALTSPWISAT